MSNTVYIVILSWNNFKDTIFCLESIFKLNYNKYKVIVCDNASDDNTISKVKNWAEGKYAISCDETVTDYRIKENIFPVVAKPIQYCQYSRSDVENGDIKPEDESRLILIQNDENLGFAAGNNSGIKYSLKQKDLGFVWLLNNDTVVDKNALSELLEKYEFNNNIGICGSTLLWYDNPDIVQVYGGGRYNPKTGSNFTNGEDTKYSVANSKNYSECKITDIRGASMFVSKDFILKVGLLNENYFLYIEEQDWSERANRAGFEVTFAHKSIVYHKEGTSIGCSDRKHTLSALGKYHFFLSRLIFTKIYYPQFLLNIYIRTILAIFYYIFKWKWNISKSIFSALKFFITQKRYEL